MDGEIIKDKLTLEEANELEEKTIKEYMTNDPEYGYNCHSGGNNHSINEITREKKFIWNNMNFNCIVEFAKYKGWSSTKAGRYIKSHKDEFTFL